MGWFKNFLKKFLPPPVNAFNRGVAEIKHYMQQYMQELHAELEMSQRQQRQQYDELLNLLNQQLLELDKVQQRVLAEEKRLFSMLERVQKQTIECSRYASEAVWAEVFNNTISDSKWLYNKSFAAGRWAVGYPYLYVMYRVLNEVQPKHILELGLGQSTKMITQYAAAHEGVKHIVIEQDKEWTEFYARVNQVGPNTRIVHLPAIEIQFRDDDKTLVYKDFKDSIGETAFDFVSVDGPGHSRSDKYRRVELIKMIPHNLNAKFCIMLDDYQDNACNNAWQIAKETLEMCGIEFCEGIYRGKKQVAMLTDVTQKYLCSM